jgi:hypothetical protein
VSCFNGNFQLNHHLIFNWRCSWWPSFGFTAGWHERGFTVAAELAAVLALARRFDQGAVRCPLPPPPPPQ